MGATVGFSLGEEAEKFLVDVLGESVDVFSVKAG